MYKYFTTPGVTPNCNLPSYVTEKHSMDGPIKTEQDQIIQGNVHI